MLFFVVYEDKVVTNGEGSFKLVSVFPNPLALDNTFTEVASTPKPALIASWDGQLGLLQN